MPIGHAEFQTKEAELVRLGVHSTEDVCLARVNKDGFMKIVKFSMSNKGKGNVTITLKKRGVQYTIPAENIEPLRVAASDRFRGPLTKKRIKPISVTIVDANVGVPQKVQDTNGDGVLWQTDGPAGPAYPVEVGKIEYETGIFDFTFVKAVTLTTVEADFQHTDWTAFTPAITFGLVAGGGARSIILFPDRAQDYTEDVRDELEWGFFGKKTASDQANTTVGLITSYIGDDSPIKLPHEKGEITGFPYHNN